MFSLIISLLPNMCNEYFILSFKVFIYRFFFSVAVLDRFLFIYVCIYLFVYLGRCCFHAFFLFVNATRVVSSSADFFTRVFAT